MAGIPTNVLDQRGVRIARCDFDGVMDGPHAGEMQANARLIAAAPQMLAVLNQLAEAYDHYQHIQAGSRSVFIKENGRAGGSPWAELCNAIESATSQRLV